MKRGEVKFANLPFLDIKRKGKKIERGILLRVGGWSRPPFLILVLKRKIVINLPLTHNNIPFKGEPYWFNS